MGASSKLWSSKFLNFLNRKQNLNILNSMMGTLNNNIRAGTLQFFSILIIITTLLISLFTYAYAYPNPGHAASQIGPGTFTAGNYVFPDNVTVQDTLNVSQNAYLPATTIIGSTCSNGQILKWNSASGQWYCADDSGSNFPGDVWVNETGDTMTGTLTISAGGLQVTGGTVSLNNLNVDSGTLYVDATNNRVGIGTTSPSQKLDIDYGNLIIQGTNSFTTNGDEAILYLGDTNQYIKSVFGSGIRIGTYGAPDAITLLQTSGNVGIGTTSPNSKLHVIGGVCVESSDTNCTASAGSIKATTIYQGNNQVLDTATVFTDSASSDATVSGTYNSLNIQLKSGVVGANEIATGAITASGGELSSTVAGNGLSLVSGALAVNVKSGGGLEITSDSLSLLQSCTSGQILEFNGTDWVCSDTATGNMTYWTIAADTGSSNVTEGQTVIIAGSSTIDTSESGRTVTISVQPDSIDGAQLADTITLDNTLSISQGSYDVDFDSGTLFINGTSNNVGIGKTNPSYKLDVNGDINIASGSKLKIGGADTVIRPATGTVAIGAYTGNISNSVFVGDYSGDNAVPATSAPMLFIGYSAGQGSTGNYPTGIGNYALVNNYGSFVTAIGDSAGRNNNGDKNTFVGYESGFNNGGTYVTAVGYRAGYGNPYSYVVAIGGDAAYGNTGSTVIAIGSYDLYPTAYQNSGNYVIAIGSSAAYQNKGNYLIALGSNAGKNNIGNYSIGIGYGGVLNNNQGNNVIAIGYGAGSGNTRDNQFIVKQANVNSVPLMQGDFSTGNLGIGTDSPDSKLHVIGGVCVESSDTNCTASAGSIKATTIYQGSNQVIDTLTAGSNAISISGSGNSRTIDVSLASTGPGLETTNGLSLIRSCSNGQILKWSSSSGWYCADDSGSNFPGDVWVNETGDTMTGTLTISAGGLQVTGGTVSLNNLNVDSGTLYVDATNNRVGIGTTSPNDVLEVRGTVSFRETTIADNGGIYINPNTYSGLSYLYSYNNLGLEIYSKEYATGITRNKLLLATGGGAPYFDFYLYNSTSSALEERMKLDYNGMLTVFGDANITGKIYQNGNQVIDTLTAGTGISISGTGNSRTIINTGDTNPSDDLTTSTSFSGDVSGTYDNLQLGTNVVGDNEINYSQVTLSDFTNDAGFITSESDTLDTVTSRGSSTTNSITVGGLTVNGLITGNQINIDSGTLYVDATNNRVGIGTISPLYVLDINGTIRIATTLNPGLTVGDGTTGYIKVGGSTVYDDNGDLTLDSDSGKLQISDDIVFPSGFNRKLYIPSTQGGSITIKAGDGDTLGSSDPGGNVYISGGYDTSGSNHGNVLLAYNGTTSIGKVGIGTGSPSYMLDVSGRARVTSSVYFATSSGSVGIGTTSPGMKLDVAGGIKVDSESETISAQIVNTIIKIPGSGSLPPSRITVYKSSLGNAIGIGNNLFWKDGGGVIKENSAYPGGLLELGRDGTLRLYRSSSGTTSYNLSLIVDSNGNVGINTASPTEKLDVNGSISAQYLKASKGVYLPTIDSASVPTCDSTNEGLMLVKKYYDSKVGTCYRYLQICMQTGTSTYAWQTLQTTSWACSG